jgi:hypothetical protein
VPAVKGGCSPDADRPAGAQYLRPVRHRRASPILERDLIRTRTAEGGSRAKARGQHKGRPPALTPAQQKEATQTPRAGRYVAVIGGQLGPQHIHHAPRYPRRLTKPQDFA